MEKSGLRCELRDDEHRRGQGPRHWSPRRRVGSQWRRPSTRGMGIWARIAA